MEVSGKAELHKRSRLEGVTRVCRALVTAAIAVGIFIIGSAPANACPLYSSGGL